MIWRRGSNDDGDPKPAEEQPRETPPRDDDPIRAINESREVVQMLRDAIATFRAQLDIVERLHPPEREGE